MAGSTKSQLERFNIQVRPLRLAAPSMDLSPEDQNFGLRDLRSILKASRSTDTFWGCALHNIVLRLIALVLVHDLANGHAVP
jgi:hypothetical protein